MDKVEYNRLERANWTGDGRFYQYDEWGNIKSVNIGLTYHYTANSTGAPATNRLDSVALSGVTQTTFSYDAAGNTTSGDSKTFAYDAVNRLKSVNSGASTYGYDGNGKRVRVTDSGASVFYIYSSKLGQSVMEVTSSGVQRAYVDMGGKIVAMQATDGQFYWIHTNHLGNSRAMTDVNGNLTYKGHFDPFGQSLNEWSSSGNNNLNSKKFTGYERDTATGLDYAQARMYNFGRGRFLTPDPTGLKGANLKKPDSLNRYSYTGNDPVNHVDLTGESYQQWQDSIAMSICRSNGGTWGITGFNAVGVPIYNCTGGVGVVNAGGYYGGNGSGQNGNQTPLAKFDLGTLTNCLANMFSSARVKLVGFRSATPGQNGYARIEYERNGASFGTEITADVKAFTGEELARSEGKIWVFGKTIPEDPITNYIANNIKQHFGIDDVTTQAIITATHVHELAHSIKVISGYDPPGEDGDELEKCVYGGIVGGDGKPH